MAQINLLPWREQLREERKQRFLASLVGVLVVAAGGIPRRSLFAGCDRTAECEERVHQKEIAVLDARIAEIKELRSVANNFWSE